MKFQEFFGKYFKNVEIIETQSKTEIDDIFLIYSLVKNLKKNTPCVILSSDNFTWFRYNREIPNSTNIHMMVARGPQINIFRNSFKLDITEFLPDEIAYGPRINQSKRQRVDFSCYRKNNNESKTKKKTQKHTNSKSETKDTDK